MLMKYIEAYVDYKGNIFTNKDIEFDQNKYSIILPKEYVEEDIKDHLYFMNHIFNNDLLDSKRYSTYSSINRAIKNKNIEAILKITYCSDISRSCGENYKLNNLSSSLDDVDKFCTGIQYQYNLRTKEISRYERDDILLYN